MRLIDSPEHRSRSRVPPSISLDDLLAATGGRLLGATTISSFAGAAVDSRVVIPGSCFVALRGEHADGHSFVADAIRAWAVAALVERPVELPAELAGVAPAVLRAISPAAVVGALGGEGVVDRPPQRLSQLPVASHAQGFGQGQRALRTGEPHRPQGREIDGRLRHPTA